MGLTDFLGVISGVFKFWDQVVWLVKILQKTPEEQKEDLVKSIQAGAEAYAKTGRPTWNP